MAIKPLVKLNAANRHVWFLSSDGETIDKIKDNQEVYSFKDADTNYRAGTGISVEEGTNKINVNVDSDTITVNPTTNIISATGNIAGNGINIINKAISINPAVVATVSSEATLSTSNTLNNNTVYSGELVSNASFSIANDCSYCSIKCTTGATAPTTISWPSSFRFYGVDCSTSSGTTSFVPVANAEYRIAVDRDNASQITCFVYKLEN